MILYHEKHPLAQIEFVIVHDAWAEGKAEALGFPKPAQKTRQKNGAKKQPRQFSSREDTMRLKIYIKDIYLWNDDITNGYDFSPKNNSFVFAESNRAFMVTPTSLLLPNNSFQLTMVKGKFVKYIAFLHEVLKKWVHEYRSIILLFYISLQLFMTFSRVTSQMTRFLQHIKFPVEFIINR